VGVPRKNVRLLNGRPLIAYSVEAAKQCRVPEADVVCSTDDAEIAQIASEAGARVPFLRPSKFATAEASHLDVVFHALDWLQLNEGISYDAVILLQPTSPFRSATHLEESYQLFQQVKARSLVSVCVALSTPYKMYTLTETGTLAKLLPYRSPAHRKQEYPAVYQENGAIFIFTPEYLRTERVFVNEHSIPYVMPQIQSLDIDTEEDMQRAEFLMSRI